MCIHYLKSLPTDRHQRTTFLFRQMKKPLSLRLHAVNARATCRWKEYKCLKWFGKGAHRPVPSVAPLSGEYTPLSPLFDWQGRIQKMNLEGANLGGLGVEFPSGVQWRSPGRGSAGRSPPEADDFSQLKGYLDVTCGILRGAWPLGPLP